MTFHRLDLVLSTQDTLFCTTACHHILNIFQSTIKVNGYGYNKLNTYIAAILTVQVSDRQKHKHTCSLHENLFLAANPVKTESKMRHKRKDGMKQNRPVQTAQTKHTVLFTVYVHLTSIIARCTMLTSNSSKPTEHLSYIG